MAAELVSLGNTIQEAQALVAVDEYGFEFVVDHSPLTVSRRELVRWSHPTANLKRPEVMLSDGSRFVLAEAWGNDASLRLVDDKVTVLTPHAGRLRLSADQLQAAIMRGPHDTKRPQKLRDELLQSKSTDDQIHLTNGDVLHGRVVAIDPPSSASRQLTFAPEGSEQQLQIPTRLATGVSWGTRADAGEKAVFAVGLSDGSLLMAADLRSAEDRFQVVLSSGASVLVEPERVVFLQAIGPTVHYLSDQRVISYNHRPYLEIIRPLATDRSILGLAMMSQGRRYFKGLGMPTAATAVYPIKANHRHFAAQVAVDDQAQGNGSVVFRVLLLENAVWQEVFSSRVLRGGDPPQSIFVDVSAATKIKLETHFADLGDQLDYANWLDARFE